MPVRTRPYDSAEYLDSGEAVSGHIEAVLEDGDPTLIIHALGVVARALGIAEIARETGLPRESLFRALNGYEGPDLGTLGEVLKTLGTRPSVKAA